MTVRTTERDIKLLKAVFEGRYDKGHRYLDYFGETVVAIQDASADWISPIAALAGTRLRHKSGLIECAFNARSFRIIFESPNKLALPEAQKHLGVFSREAETLYEIIVNCIKVPNTTRVGAFFSFVAPADSVEESDKFVCRASASPFSEQIAQATHAQIIDADVKFTGQDESGYRRHIRLVSLADLVREGAPAQHGFPDEESAGYVGLEVDTYTRPDSGHFSNVEQFINDAYSKSCTHSQSLFRWMKTGRK